MKQFACHFVNPYHILPKNKIQDKSSLNRFCFRNYYTAPKIKDPQDNSAGFSAILEESEDDMSRSTSPAFFEMAGERDNVSEKRDGGDVIPVMPWRGLLRKANSKVNLNE